MRRSNWPYSFFPGALAIVPLPRVTQHGLLLRFTAAFCGPCGPLQRFFETDVDFQIPSKQMAFTASATQTPPVPTNLLKIALSTSFAQGGCRTVTGGEVAFRASERQGIRVTV